MRRLRARVRRAPRAWAGSSPSRPTSTNPRFLRMLVEVKRFHRAARRLLDDDQPADGEPTGPHGGPLTLGDFLAAGQLHAVLPPALHGAAGLVRVVVRAAHRAAVPGALAVHLPRPPRRAAASPARPSWRTVVGGSRSYVERAAKELTATELSTPVRSVRRIADRHRDPRRRRRPAHASTPPSSPPTPTTRSGCSSTPPPPNGRRSARSRRRSTRRCCTPTARCSRRTRVPGRRGTTSSTTARRPPTRCTSATT